MWRTTAFVGWDVICWAGGRRKWDLGGGWRGIKGANGGIKAVHTSYILLLIVIKIARF